MQSSLWRAAGNTYAVVWALGAPLAAHDVSQLVGHADGVLEVLDVSADRIEIAIWNPDGSDAELSGNGTRMARRSIWC
jgi:diaminopimelate epimerase